MDINLIGMPLMYGCDRDGVQFGPKVLRENKIVDLAKKYNHNMVDIGDVNVPLTTAEFKYQAHPKAKYLNFVVESNNNLADVVFKSLEDNKFPFVVGGDHSLGTGSIAGASKHFKELAVIWIDAHGDINTFDTSPTGNIHGMPLAAAMNIGDSSLTNIYYEGQKVKPENVYILGGRDIDSGEFDLVDEYNLNMYTMDDVRERGFDNVLSEIISKIKNSNVDGVHISFDIDVLDSTIVPGTGTPVIDGFTLQEGKDVLSTLIGEGFVTSMDFVEFNPKIDTEDKITLSTCLEMLDHIFKII